MNTNRQNRWVIWNEIRRVLILPYVRLYFFVRGVNYGKKWRILGTPIIQRYGRSIIQIGDNLIMRSRTISNPVSPYHPVFLSTRNNNAEIKIGNDCGITGGSIIAAERITIGDRVLIGSNCLIIDTDFHPLNKATRQEQPLQAKIQPVSISDDVFIGTQAIILKGTKIGTGSIIGAGSVVSGEIPAGVVAAGNPAVIVRHLD